MVEFKEDGTIKPKMYPDECVVEGPIQQLVIIITYEKCTFSVNDSV